MVWVCGDTTAIDQKVRDLARCRGMVSKYSKIRESLSPAKKLLLQSEEIRREELESEVRDAVAASWKSGKFYYDGDRYEAREHGSFGTAVTRTATTILPALFPHFDATTIVPSELAQLLEPELSGPSIKFMEDHLGILGNARHPRTTTHRMASQARCGRSRIDRADAAAHRDGTTLGVLRPATDSRGCSGACERKCA